MENKYQVFGEFGRNLIMKISILMYLSNPAEDKLVYQNLLQAGIRVCKIGDISRLHTILESHFYDCILVNRSILKLYELSAKQHIWNAQSPQTILCWTRNADGDISFETHSLTEELCGLSRPSDHCEKIEYVKDTLSGINRIHHQTNQPNQIIHAQQLPVMHISEELHLHKKIRLILEYLINSGETGMTCGELIDRIWGKSEKNRIKDIQSYVSKLRSILSRTDTMQYQIMYSNNRYYLREMKSNSKPVVGHQ